MLETYTNHIDFIKDINKLRLSNQNKWHFVGCTVEGKEIKIKFFKTWLQIYNVNNINYANCMDRNIKGFKDDLAKPFKG